MRQSTSGRSSSTMSLWTVVVMAAGIVACGSSGSIPGHVEISGKSPSQGAALAAGAVCRREARCGEVTIACMGGGSAAGSGSDATTLMTTCTGRIEPVDYDHCFTEASADVEKLLSCASLTADQIDTLETCFDALAAQPCVTQAEADAQAHAAESGTSPPPEPPPASCDLLLASPPPGC